jgi:dihydroorotase
LRTGGGGVDVASPLSWAASTPGGTGSFDRTGGGGGSFERTGGGGAVLALTGAGLAAGLLLRTGAGGGAERPAPGRGTAALGFLIDSPSSAIRGKTSLTRLAFRLSGAEALVKHGQFAIFLGCAGLAGAVLSPAAVPDAPQLIVIRGVRAIDPARSLDATVDVTIEGGTITRVGPGAASAVAKAEGARVIDAAGLWLLPAFVDMHAHLREPGQEYKEEIATGLNAAAAGGYAHVCVMPNTRPVNDTRAVTELMLRRAEEHDGAVLHPIAAITMGQKGKDLTEMAELRDAGIVGVSDDGVCVMSSAVMRRALEYAKNFDIPVIQHAEDHDLTAGAEMHEGNVSARLGLRGWPRIAEDVIIARDVLLAEYTRARYHAAHISTLGAVRIMREAKSRGIDATAEVTPHHLLLTDASVIGYDTACKVNPPLREPEDVDALRRALADGTIDAIATDHAPHSPLEKDCEFSEASPGMIGLELCFGLLLGLVGESGITLGRLLEALSTRPARIIGVEPPSIREGARAVLTLVDPGARYRVEDMLLRSKSRNTPFMKHEMTAKVLMTLARGKIVFDGLGAR